MRWTTLSMGAVTGRFQSACWTVAGWIFVNLIVAWYLGLFDGGSGRVKKVPSSRAEAAYNRDTDIGMRSGSSGHLLYRVLRPPRDGVKVPLVIFLHGAGERGTDNATQLVGLPEQLAESEMRMRFPCICLAPQCPEESSWIHQLDSLERLIEQWHSDPQVDPCRIYLTGLSMGGYGTWHLVSRRPDLFAAAVPVCGGGDPTQASKLIHLPIWAIHGQDDRVVLPSESRAMIEAVRAAGGKPEYTELPGVGHDSWTKSYNDPTGPIPWMFRQRRPDCGP